MATGEGQAYIKAGKDKAKVRRLANKKKRAQRGGKGNSNGA